MFKKMLLAVVPMVLVTSIAMADDLFGDVASLKADMIQAAPIAVEDLGLDGLDVESLAQNAGGESDEAIEACFRRVGYGGWGRGYGGWGRGYGWGHGFGYGYRAFHQPFYCYRPVTYCYPVVSYWGCY